MNMAWTQPVCTDCWVRENSIEDPLGYGGMVRVPARVLLSDEAPWEESLNICCKCGRITASGIYVRVDPSTVPFASEREDDD